MDAGSFIQTDVYGTFVLLAARKHEISRFLQVSTDEVYGDIPVGSSKEQDPLRPEAPTPPVKLAEMMVQAYHTYGYLC